MSERGGIAMAQASARPAVGLLLAGPVPAGAWLKPASAGLVGALLLVGLYLALVTWAQGFGHARELLWGDRYFVAGIAGGFGTQVGLFVYVRRLVARRMAGSAAGVTVAGTGTSTAAMVACCAHHLADLLPLVGATAAATFLYDYRLPFVFVGVGLNAIAITVVLRRLRKITTVHEEVEHACALDGSSH